MKNYRWGIVGPGKIAAKFAVALPLAGRASLDAVASREENRAKEFAGKFGAVRYYTRYEELAADPDIDAVYIATPHGFHAEHAILFLQHGKAVLCEKPMALSGRQVQQMTKAARDNKAFLMEAMWTRFLPVMHKVMELIRNGQLGTVKQVRGDFGFFASFNPDGRLFDLRLGGGSLLDIGIYPLFLCLLLLGEPDSVHAAGHLSPTGSDETCQAILSYRDGRSALISSTVACQTSLTAEIAGTEGMIQMPTPWYKNDKFTLVRPGEEPQLISVEPMVNGFEYQIREVTQCLDNGLLESPLHSHADSLRLSRTMDAIRGQMGVKYPGE